MTELLPLTIGLLVTGRDTGLGNNHENKFTLYLRAVSNNPWYIRVCCFHHLLLANGTYYFVKCERKTDKRKGKRARVIFPGKLQVCRQSGSVLPLNFL